MKILKFGGKSLSNGKGLNTALQIIQSEAKKGPIAVVVSARGNATNELETMLHKAKQGKSYGQEFSVFKREQVRPLLELDLFHEFTALKETLEAVKVLRDYSPKIYYFVLAQGELISVKMISALLRKKGLKAMEVNAKNLLVTEEFANENSILDKASQVKTNAFFDQQNPDIIPIITGFIAANADGDITTLGRNGSNYSASLIAKYAQATEVLSYTNVDGVFTANPDEVSDAQSISNLSYQEANELASFGASILHEKTISPLVPGNIPLRILNTFNPDFQGTLINGNGASNGVKSISVQKNTSLIQVEGDGLLGKVGIDARIFETLKSINVSIGVVSQGSTERGVSFLVDQNNADKSVNALRKTFEFEIERNEVDNVNSRKDVSVITIVGQGINTFHTSLKSLTTNKIEVLLINNTTPGNNVSLVVKTSDVEKAVNLIHSQIFGISKRINIAIFGKGTVGGSLIHQILKSQSTIEKRKGIKLNIFAIAGTKNILLNKNGVSKNWESDFSKTATSTNLDSVTEVINYANTHHFENLIAIDNTASTEFVKQYAKLIENGFDLISSNKLANTQSYSAYKKLRELLHQNGKKYLYETNVGAGLPLIDTIKLLHDSGENITRIKGVFSGSLSFLFNQFSERNDDFSTVLTEAINLGYTEPDPREDLCGNDVARKLLILARELDLENEIEDIEIKNLVPKNLLKLDKDAFFKQLKSFNAEYNEIKNNQKPNHVLRYVGELYGNLQETKGQLKVELVSVPKTSALGQISGSDSIVEIFTESYGDNPIVIQGAGAGAEVTARGVFGDLLRISDKK